MKIKVGVVLKFEHADKLAKILGINGLEVAEYHPVFEVPWCDGTVSRHETFDAAVKAYALDAKYRADTTPATARGQHE